MESPNKNKRCPLLGLAALLLLFITMAPVAATFPLFELDQDNQNPRGHIQVSLDHATGLFIWRPYIGASRYQIRYRKCNDYTQDVFLDGQAHSSYQIPGYDNEVRVTIHVFAFGIDDYTGQERKLNSGHVSNNLYCNWSPDAPDYADRIGSTTPTPVPPPDPANTPAPWNPPGKTTLNDLFAPRGVSVRLNNETGRVDWGAVTGATRYEISYNGCRMPRLVLQAFGLHYFEIPGYESSVRYDVRIDVYDGQQTLLGYGTASNQRYCGNTSGNTPSQQQRSVQTRSSQLVQKNMIVSPHAGSSLVVFVDAGQIHAQDNIRGSSLSAPGSCSPGQSLAANDSLMISCTSDGHFIVLQVHPQHPADKRRDLVVFNSSLTYCYRAYEYTETGAIEVFYSLCGDN